MGMIRAPDKMFSIRSSVITRITKNTTQEHWLSINSAMKLRFIFYYIFKKLKMVQDIIVRPEAIKLLE